MHDEHKQAGISAAIRAHTKAIERVLVDWRGAEKGEPFPDLTPLNETLAARLGVLHDDTNQAIHH